MFLLLYRVCVHKKQGDCRFIPAQGYIIEKNRPGWEKMNAIMNHQVHVLDEPLFCKREASAPPAPLSPLKQTLH